MTDDQFTKLSQQISRLDAKFDAKLDARTNGLEKKIDGLNRRINGLDEGFLKFFQYVERRFNSLEAKLDSKADKKDVGRLYALVDGIVKRLDEGETERTAMIAQLNRHEHWHHQAADKISINLMYD